MILFIATWIAKIFAIDANKAKKWATYLLIFLGLFLFLFIILGVRSCLSKDAKSDQESIEKINSADRTKRLEELEKIVNDNQDVIKTNDNRTLETENNIEERNRQIDEKIKEADKKIEEAKNQGKNVTSEELECILIPENCKK